MGRGFGIGFRLCFTNGLLSVWGVLLKLSELFDSALCELSAPCAGELPSVTNTHALLF